MKEDWQNMAIVEEGRWYLRIYHSLYCCECLNISKVKWFWKWETKMSLFVLKQNFTIEKCRDLPFFCSRFSSSWEQPLCTQGSFPSWQFTLQHSSQMCYSVLLSLLLYFCLLLVFTSLPIHQLDLPLCDLIWSFVLGIGSPCTLPSTVWDTRWTEPSLIKETIRLAGGHLYFFPGWWNDNVVLP